MDIKAYIKVNLASLKDIKAKLRILRPRLTFLNLFGALVDQHSRVV